MIIATVTSFLCWHGLSFILGAAAWALVVHRNPRVQDEASKLADTLSNKK